MSIATRTQALKKLYKAVVGEDTTKNDPTKIISELADNWSGGGGSSDFSTAQVTVVNSTEHSGIELVLPVCTEEITGQGSPACIMPYNHISVGTYNVSVAMYKGAAVCFIMTSNVNVSTDGAVTNKDGGLIITGDCTITIS